MALRILSILLLLSLLITLSSSVQAQKHTIEGGTALLAIEIPSTDALSRFEATGLPAYARLQGIHPQETLLTGAHAAGLALLNRAGLTFRILDADMRGASYYLVYAHPGLDLRQIEWSDYGRLLLDDGVQVLLRATARQVESLAQAGGELRRVTFDPKPLRAFASPLTLSDVVEADPLIQGMIDQVDSNSVYAYTGDLSGEWPAYVGSEWYTITTRYTYSGVPIQKATQLAGEHFTDLGLDVEYHKWNTTTNPNVIAELPGLVNPQDIFIIGGHLDDVPFSGLAPGADDNASGSVATLITADILSQYEWGCTLRFALWTGEEQGLLGSHYYALRSYQQGENILGYLNLDMISYNTIGSSPDIDLIYNPSLPLTQQLAQLFNDIVAGYSLDLVPQLLSELGGGSDHSSFWDYGYTSILAIEDQSDFNPQYHTAGDTIENQNLTYYTEFVKAALGTFAHMTNCLLPGGTGVLNGTVTAEEDGVPIAGASVMAQNSAGNAFSALTDASGSYTQTMLADTYTVTVSADGYLPVTVTDVEIITGTVTTQDFALNTPACILLVDDDDNDPDVLPYFTAALDSLGYDYNIFDVGGTEGNGPDPDRLSGYGMAMWFSGDKLGGSAGPNASDEGNLAAYLQAGGKLFLSSQDYLDDNGLTSFGQNYLGIASFSDDKGDATIRYGMTGDPIGDGLGPYPLSYPAGFSDYGDIVNAGSLGSVAFRSNQDSGKALDIDVDGGDWKTVFFGTSWVPVHNYSADNGEELLGRILEWLGGCELIPAIELSKTVGTAPNTCATTDSITLTAGSEVTYCFEATNVGNATFSLHDLVDSDLGIIRDDFPYVLSPGETIVVTQTATILTDTVNTATWTAFVETGTASALSSASASVTVVLPEVEQRWFFLPVVYKE